MGAIDDDLEAAQVAALGERGFDELDVAAGRIVDALGAAKFG